VIHAETVRYCTTFGFLHRKGRDGICTDIVRQSARACSVIKTAGRLRGIRAVASSGNLTQAGIAVPAVACCRISIQKDEIDMTKAKARQRAKAKSAQRAKKQDTEVDLPGKKIRPGQFDPGASSIKGPRVNANTKSFGGAKRGSARSR